MAGEKITEKDQPLATESKSDTINKSAEHDVTSGINGIPSELTSTMASLGNAPSSKKGETNEESAGELGARNQPTIFNNYLYPAYSGPFTQVDNNGFFHTDASQTGMQSDNGSLIYYLPGYNPYGTGAIIGVDGQCVGQQPYFSPSGYLQHQAMPCYTWDSTYVGDAQNGNSAGFGNAKYGGSAAYGKSNSFNHMKTNGNDANKFSESSYAQPMKPLSKLPQLGSDFTAGLLKEYPSMGKYSSFANQKQGLYPHNGLVNYKKNGRLWNGNDRYNSRDRFSRNGDLELAVELTRGPRAHNKSAPLDSSVKKEELGLAGHRDQYNLADFQTEYEKAKFYVIKSYNEDDIHKCIKYNVWASTPNGSKKLDAAFHEVELKTGETETRCPIFLFFSVNGSGQFVGLAEMVGQVDFNKDMDFWQLDKWNGFFPVKWHVIKDVPNAQLRHIILENNENKPVTHSRDTQEIGLQQGLEMLKIFKSYTSKSSLLDDFNFYETREKSQNVKKSNKPVTQRIKDDGFPKHVKVEERNFEESLVNLTKNLSLGALPTE